MSITVVYSYFDNRGKMEGKNMIIQVDESWIHGNLF